MISTFERPEACLRALRSALEQTRAPDEVLVCDDASRDRTSELFRHWAEVDHRVRYLRTKWNFGSPGGPRNLGIAEATGEWIAFLDDDDRWLPGKLARQLELTEVSDVIGTNAVRSDGRAYFARGREAAPSRRDVLRDNPLIASTVMARRELLLAAGGFMTARWARGVADYAMWLALADRGARFVVLPEPLVQYESAATDRMSAAPVAQELAVARLTWQRWLRRPREFVLLRVALSRSVAALALWRSRWSVRAGS